jgi:hypothetical protein
MENFNMSNFIVTIVCLLVSGLCLYFVTKPKKKKSRYDIVYKPLSDRYYPRYNGYYIFKWNSGRYSLECSPEGCEYGRSETSAKNIIELHKEARGLKDRVIEIEQE